MPKRDRRHRRALIALAIIIGGAVLAAGLGLLEQAQRQAYREPTSSGTNSEYQDSQDWWEDSFPQWLMAVFAVAATGVGIWTILLLRDTVRATRKGNRITRESAERQLRAYVSVDFSGIREADDTGDAIGFVKIKNVGQIPATDVRVRVSMDIGPKDRVDFDQSDATEDIGALQPSANITRGTEPVRWSVLLVENEFVYVFGIVNYLDGFKQPRVTKFCHRYRTKDMLSIYAPGLGKVGKEIRAEDGRQHRTGNDVT